MTDGTFFFKHMRLLVAVGGAWIKHIGRVWSGRIAESADYIHFSVWKTFEFFNKNRNRFFFSRLNTKLWFWFILQVWFFTCFQHRNIYIFIIYCAKMLIAKSNNINKSVCDNVSNSKSHDVHKLHYHKVIVHLLLFQSISYIISHIKIFKLLI